MDIVNCDEHSDMHGYFSEENISNVECGMFIVLRLLR